jgi:hypothetical protein
LHLSSERRKKDADPQPSEDGSTEEVAPQQDGSATCASTRALTLLEMLLEKGPRVADWGLVSKRVQQVMVGNETFWRGGWAAHCSNARFVGAWMSFVRTVLLTSEALSADLLRMLLVEQRGW